MRKSWKYIISIIMISAMILTGCGLSGSSQTKSNTTNTVQATASSDSTDSKVVVDKEFSARDLDVGYEDSTATHITLDGSEIIVDGDGATGKNRVLTINKEGTFVVTGTLKDGQIVVDVADTEKVQIVLNGASINCTNNAPIYIQNADKVFITLPDKTQNSLSDGTEYVQTDDNNVDGVIFSKADLTLNGDGILNITGNYKHGIASKDDIVITGGTFNITAVKDAINGKDCVKIKDGILNLRAATGDGIQSKNDEDNTKGYVYICGGDINILKSNEGIEGTVIVIEDGIVNMTSDDDGFNAASGNSDTAEEKTNRVDTKDTVRKSNTEVETDTTLSATVNDKIIESTDATTNEEGTVPEKTGRRGFGGGGGNSFEADTNCYISISGGTVKIDASGDGIDSNGSLYISGGNIYVSGPTNSGNGGLDYNGTAEITGGIVIVTGSLGMAQAFSDTSSQYSLLYNLTTAANGGTEVKLADKDGNVLASYTPTKQYQSVVLSIPDFAKDETYILTSGDQAAEITLTDVVTSNGQQGMGGLGNPGGKGKRPDFNNMKEPEDSNTTDSTL